jgi:signal transduction histidine kinase
MRRGQLILAFTLFAAVAVGATGAVLLARSWSASLQAVADRQRLLLESRAHLIGDELDRLVRETGRLSQLAEVDLADANLEPEKRVLKIARRDSALFSVAIAILDSEGKVLWAEPQGATPGEAAAALVGAARGRGRPILAARPGEIDVAAPIAGRGAIVAIVNGERQDLFGQAVTKELGASGMVAIVRPQTGGDLVVLEAGARLSGFRVSGGGQAWQSDSQRRRWLVTEAPLSGTDLWVRLVQAADELDDELSKPFQRLVVTLAAALLLAILGGALLAYAIGRLETAEVELQASRELAAMGKTAAAIAHEVKNALNGLQVAVELLASGRADENTARAVQAQVREEVARLRGVADDLTFFSAPPRLQLGEADLNDLCRRAAEAVESRAKEAGVSIALELSAVPLPLRADAGKLYGALLNLARNGVEAMGPGAFGESLGAPPANRERRLIIASRSEAGGAVADVSDTGPGVSPQARAHLFEPFFTTKRTGTGLGLAIVQRVLEAHRGRIEVLDRPGGGALFRVHLPAQGPLAEGAAE